LFELDIVTRALTLLTVPIRKSYEADPLAETPGHALATAEAQNPGVRVIVLPACKTTAELPLTANELLALIVPADCSVTLLFPDKVISPDIVIELLA
jgi:hypothetical protein